MRTLVLLALCGLLGCDGPSVTLARRAGVDAAEPDAQEPNTHDESNEQNGPQGDEQACRVDGDCDDKTHSLCNPARQICVACIVATDCPGNSACDVDGECDGAD